MTQTASRTASFGLFRAWQHLAAGRRGGIEGRCLVRASHSTLPAGASCSQNCVGWYLSFVGIDQLGVWRGAIVEGSGRQSRLSLPKLVLEALDSKEKMRELQPHSLTSIHLGAARSTTRSTWHYCYNQHYVGTYWAPESSPQHHGYPASGSLNRPIPHTCADGSDFTVDVNPTLQLSGLELGHHSLMSCGSFSSQASTTVKQRPQQQQNGSIRAFAERSAPSSSMGQVHTRRSLISPPKTVYTNSKLQARKLNGRPSG